MAPSPLLLLLLLLELHYLGRRHCAAHTTRAAGWLLLQHDWFGFVLAEKTPAPHTPDRRSIRARIFFFALGVVCVTFAGCWMLLDGDDAVRERDRSTTLYRTARSVLERERGETDGMLRCCRCCTIPVPYGRSRCSQRHVPTLRRLQYGNAVSTRHVFGSLCLPAVRASPYDHMINIVAHDYFTTVQYWPYRLATILLYSLQ